MRLEAFVPAVRLLAVDDGSVFFEAGEKGSLTPLVPLSSEMELVFLPAARRTRNLGWGGGLVVLLSFYNLAKLARLRIRA